VVVSGFETVESLKCVASRQEKIENRKIEDQKIEDQQIEEKINIPNVKVVELVDLSNNPIRVEVPMIEKFEDEKVTD